MIDHLGFPVSDYERAKTFYTKALAPLGYSLIMEVTQQQTGHDPAAGFGADGKPDFWIGGEGALNRRCMWRYQPGIAPRWMRSTRRRSRPAGATTGRPAFAPITTPPITARLYSIPTAIISKRSVTHRNRRACEAQEEEHRGIGNVFIFRATNCR